MAGEGWLSVREAAEAAGVGQNTIRYWIGCGRLPALASDDGRQVVEAAALDRLLTARRAAEAAGLRVSTLMRWVDEGQAP